LNKGETIRGMQAIATDPVQQTIKDAVKRPASVTWTILGSVLGFLARPCCSIPFFLSLLGLSSSGLGVILIPYRTAFVAAIVPVFACAGYRTFRVHGAIVNKIFFSASLLGSALFYISPLLF